MAADKFMLIKVVYSRPTEAQAFNECLKDYIQHHENSASVESLVALARKDLAKEKKDLEST